MPRRTAARARPAAPAEPPQLELFPEATVVEALDAARVAGARTRVAGVWRVRYPTEPTAHRVFHDRHGWYCEQHGRECRAVRAARAGTPAA